MASAAGYPGTPTSRYQSSPSFQSWHAFLSCWRFFMWFQVQKLQRAALKDPVKCMVSTKYSTVEKLQQYYIFIPTKYKVRHIVLSRFIVLSRAPLSSEHHGLVIIVFWEFLTVFCAGVFVLWQDCYLVSIINELAGNSFMIFCSTCNNAQRVALLLRNLGITAIPLHGQMSQVDLHTHTLLSLFFCQTQSTITSLSSNTGAELFPALPAEYSKKQSFLFTWRWLISRSTDVHYFNCWLKMHFFKPTMTKYVLIVLFQLTSYSW